MTPEQFKLWRKSLGLTQQSAADALGLSRRAVQDYEAETYAIPKVVELACCELSRRLILPQPGQGAE